jgi:hypothetical protein
VGLVATELVDKGICVEQTFTDGVSPCGGVDGGAARAAVRDSGGDVPSTVMAMASIGEPLQHNQRMEEVSQCLRGRDGRSGWTSSSNGNDDGARSKSR